MSPRRLAALAIMIPTLAAAQGPLKYPDTRRADTVETLHGRAVPDPYRWLEDPNSDETKAWIAAENRVTFGYLEQIPHAHEDQGAAHAPLELRALRHAVARGRLVHLREKRRPAEPVGHLQDQGARRAGGDPDRPQLALERRDGRPRQPLVQRRRQVPGVFAVGRAAPTGSNGACATWRRAATCPTCSSGASSAAPPGSRTARVSSTAATTRRKRARRSPA